MGREIVYCCRCSTILRSRDFEEGRASRFDEYNYCSNCLPEVEKEAPVPAPTPAPEPVKPRERPTFRRHATPVTKRPPARRSSRKAAAFILAAAAGVIAIVIVAALSLSKNTPPPPTSATKPQKPPKPPSTTKPPNPQPPSPPVKIPPPKPVPKPEPPKPLPPPPLPPGLLARWDFEGTGPEVRDASDNSHTGKMEAGASRAEGLKGKGLLLEPAGAFVRIPQHPDLAPKAVTIALWVNPQGEIAIFANLFRRTWKNNSGKTYCSWALQLNPRNENSTILAFITGHNGTFNRLNTPPDSIPPGVWTHIAAVYDPDGPAPQKRIYLNGKLAVSCEETQPLVYDASETGDLYFGQNGKGEERYTGMIDEVLLFKRALTDAEIEKLAVR